MTLLETLDRLDEFYAHNNRSFEFGALSWREWPSISKEVRKYMEVLELIRDCTYTDAEGPELRAQNMRNHIEAKRALEQGRGE